MNIWKNVMTMDIYQLTCNREQGINYLYFYLLTDNIFIKGRQHADEWNGVTRKVWGMNMGACTLEQSISFRKKL